MSFIYTHLHHCIFFCGLHVIQFLTDSITPIKVAFLHYLYLSSCFEYTCFDIFTSQHFFRCAFLNCRWFILILFETQNFRTRTTKRNKCLTQSSFQRSDSEFSLFRIVLVFSLWVKISSPKIIPCADIFPKPDVFCLSYRRVFFFKCPSSLNLWIRSTYNRSISQCAICGLEASLAWAYGVAPPMTVDQSAANPCFF